MLFKIHFLALSCFMLVLGFRNLKSNSVPLNGLKIEKLPINRDLMKYLGALNRVIAFSRKHENDIDINFCFGLFLVNVNLKHALREKHRVLPKKLETYVKEIIRSTENLIVHFKHKIANSHDLRNFKYKSIFSLFMNATAWTNRLPKFLATHLNVTLPYLKNANTEWSIYKAKVDDKFAWVPNPYQSDLCLASLASAKEVQIGTSRRCTVLKSCYDMVENGTDFGYALAHRLLFLQQARFGRGCSVFSEQKDEHIRQRLCSAAYQEAEYIAMHDFEVIDLLLEHVCLCALEGYTHFVKRVWLAKILNFQTVHGCFSPYTRSTSNKVAPPVAHGLDGYCNAHTTAVAAGTLAMVSRFILLFYF